MLIYVAIALFILIILWLALQPKQGTRAANAPDPADITHQLPKPQSPPDKKSSLVQVPYEQPEPKPHQHQAKSISDPDIQVELKSLMQRSQTIEALRLVRTTTGWGLKRAKDYLYALERPEIESVEELDTKERITMLMQQNQKVQAIKLVRSATGWGLKESKEYVEQFPNLGPLPNPKPNAPSAATVEAFDIDRHDINVRIQLLMEQHQKIRAIKLVRTVTQWGLKEAKDYVERYPDLPPLPVTISGPVSPQIQKLLSEQKYMDAIHLVEKRTGMMTTEAKDYIEQNFNCQFPF
ncbi:MAG: ribosomal protein L7/L12 [Cyanobacteria bacterium P01_F01_bin.116]